MDQNDYDDPNDHLPDFGLPTLFDWPDGTPLGKKVGDTIIVIAMCVPVIICAIPWEKILRKILRGVGLVVVYAITSTHAIPWKTVGSIGAIALMLILTVFCLGQW